jgi:hypothetical protein
MEGIRLLFIFYLYVYKSTCFERQALDDWTTEVRLQTGRRYLPHRIETGTTAHQLPCLVVAMKYICGYKVVEGRS